MDNLLRISFVLAAISMLTACGTVSGWLTEEVYEAPPEELVEFSPEFQVVTAWSVDAGDGTDDPYSDLAVWIQGEMIVAVDYEGDVSSYDLQTGNNLWQTELEVPVIAGAGGGEGLILIGTQEGEILALNELSGELLWKHQLSSEVLAPPKAAMGVVVVRTADGRMSGLSISDGSVLWGYQRAVPLLSLRGASAPVLAEDKVIAGYANGKLVALSLVDGKVIWEKSVSVPRGRSELDRLVDIDSEPVVIDGRVYVVAYNGQLASFDLATGRKLWSRDMSSHSGLDVTPADAVYVTDDSSYIWALQDGTGDALWRQTRLLRRKVTAPTIVGDYVVVGDFEGYIHWIAREDGRFVARVEISDHAIRSKPVVRNDVVYITASDGRLTALRVQ